MSAREIATRLQYAATCAIERRAHRNGTLTGPARLRDALTADLRRRPDWTAALLASRPASAARFFAGCTEREGMLALFGSRYARERRAAIEAADRVLGGEVSFFGQTFRLEPGSWNRDPVSGVEWPRRYHRDVPIHGGNRGWGDVKYVWELNRHQFLVDLARASFLTGRPEYAARLRELVADWMQDNPCATGVNWACALEPAFRVFSWLWSYYLCLDRQAEDPDHHLRWLAGFYDHGRFLHAHLEHYSSPYNHLIGEACALYMLGLLFPEFREAASWRRRGRRVLEGRLGTQFYADGGSVEQSTFYHHATLGFYVLTALLGRRHGEEFDSRVWRAIEQAMVFSTSLVQPDGRTPSIGGADDGKPLRMEHLPFWDFRPFQAIGTVLFGRADFKQVAGGFHEDALWLLGPAGLADFERVPAAPPAEASAALPHSGYYVLRSGWSAQDDYVCIDCGPQAGDVRTDGVPNSVHGHADCLSLVAWLGGRPVLVDPGLLCYNGDPAWEAHFRRTAAHSTVRIDGRDQALHLGKMAWAYSYRATPELFRSGNGHSVFVGRHDGFTRRGGDTIHRRAVLLAPGRYLVIYDELECATAHRAELAFQFAPGTLDITEDGATYERDIRLAWTSSVPWEVRAVCGEPGAEGGWIAPSLGVLRPAPRLTLSTAIGPPRCAVMTVIADTRGGQLTVDAIASGTLRVRGEHFEDHIVAPSLVPATAADPGERIVITRVRGAGDEPFAAARAGDGTLVPR